MRTARPGSRPQRSGFLFSFQFTSCRWKSSGRPSHGEREGCAAATRALGNGNIRREARFSASMATFSLSSGWPVSTGARYPEAVRPVPGSLGRLAAARTRGHLAAVCRRLAVCWQKPRHMARFWPRWRESVSSNSTGIPIECCNSTREDFPIPGVPGLVSDTRRKPHRWRPGADQVPATVNFDELVEACSRGRGEERFR